MHKLVITFAVVIVS